MASPLTREQYLKALNECWADACREAEMTSDGVSLCSAAHPRAPWYRRLWFWLRRPKLSPESLETIEIEIRDTPKGGLLSGVFVNDQEIEKEIQAKGLTAPRVTLEHIESRIALECYTTGDCFSVWRYDVESTEEKHRLLGELQLITVCILILQNGFKVVGESACVSRENFNEELGRKIARQKAVEEIWALEGYLLKEHEYAPAG